MGSAGNGRNKARGIVLKALALIGGAILLRKLTRSATRWDHARVVANALSGEKFSYEQACRDPTNYFNLRMLTCPAAVTLDGSKVLYFEQAFWRTPEKPFRQRFYMVKPCSKEMKCDVEVPDATACRYLVHDSGCKHEFLRVLSDGNLNSADDLVCYAMSSSCSS